MGLYKANKWQERLICARREEKKNCYAQEIEVMKEEFFRKGWMRVWVFNRRFRRR